MNIINNSEVLGSLGKDLVLNTLGKVYIRVGDRYYELDFRKEILDVSENKEENIIYNPESDIIITKYISDIEYPGDNKFIISLDGKFYITYNGKFKNVTPKTSASTSGSIKISTIEDVNVIGQLYSDNLIVDFLSGDITAETLTVDKIIAKSIISDSLNTSVQDRFIKGSGKLYIGPEVTVKDIDYDDSFVYFKIDSIDSSLFPIGSIVTNDIDSFVGEILNVSEYDIKVKVLSGNVENTYKLILKGDYIEYSNKGQSYYNKTYNLRIEEIKESGDYSDLEFAIISSNVKIVLKNGSFIKCTKDCNVDINGNLHYLYSNTLYLLHDSELINLTNSVKYFNTYDEFKNSDIKTSELVFIKETEQIYYNGLFIGSNKGKLPDNFKIEEAHNGALISYEDGIGSPTYNYATYKYVDNRINELLNNAPDAADTLGEIANVLKNNINSIGDIILAIGEISKDINTKVSYDEFISEIKRIESSFESIDLNNIFTVLNTKATGTALEEVNNRFDDYASKAYVEEAILRIDLSKYDKKLEIVDLQIKELQSQDKLVIAKIEELTSVDNIIKNSISDLTNRVLKLEEFNQSILNDYLKKSDADLLYTPLAEFNNLKAEVEYLKNNKIPGSSDFFELDEDGNLHIKGDLGLWTNGFITSGGINDDSSGGESSGLDIESLESYLNNNKYLTESSANNLYLSIYDANAKFNIINSNITNINNNISGINIEINDIKYNISEINESIVNINTSISDINTKITNLETRVGELEYLKEMFEGSDKTNPRSIRALAGLGSDSFITSGGINDSANQGVSIDILSIGPSVGTDEYDNYVLSAKLGGELKNSSSSGGNSITYTAGIGIDISNNIISIDTDYFNKDLYYTKTEINNTLNGYQPLISSSNKIPYSYISGTPTIPSTSNFLSINGGIINGNLRLQRTGENYGTYLRFGDGDYAYIAEINDDELTIKATEIHLNGSVFVNGVAYSGGSSVDLSNYATKDWVRNTALDGYATTSDLGSYLPKTGGTISGSLTVNGSFYASSVTHGSDIRHKSILNDIAEDVDFIANAPLFNFTWDNDADKTPHLGTSAQYWLNTELCKAVSYDKKNDFYGLAYGELGVGIGIINSRKLVNHEERLNKLELFYGRFCDGME